MIKYLTAGESHSRAMSGIVDGLPRGIVINSDTIACELKLRRSGVGRSGRQIIEEDKVEFTGGVNNMTTIGTPLSFVVFNADCWYGSEAKPITQLRSGHADFAGCKRFDILDARDICEHSSARSTLPVVVIGSVCKQALKLFGITLSHAVLCVGGKSNVEQAISEAKELGDSLGGKVKVNIHGLRAGIGSFGQFFDKLDGRLSGIAMSIPSVKAVEIGLGSEFCQQLGSNCADKFELVNNQIKYATNNVGGLCGGLTTGEDIVLTLSVKPVPTFARQSNSIDIASKMQVPQHFERADICVVDNVGLIATDMLAIEVFNQLIECVGGYSISEMVERWKK